MKRTNKSDRVCSEVKFSGAIWGGDRMAEGDEGILDGSEIGTAVARAKGSRLRNEGKMWSGDMGKNRCVRGWEAGGGHKKKLSVG